MRQAFVRAASILVMAATAGCSAAVTRPGPLIISPSGQSPASAMSRPISDADVHFVTGMIPHHAQAVKMAQWAESHQAGREVALLCERIDVSQRDEIRLMRSWLSQNGKPVPDSNATHMRMTMDGMAHDMLMPGMLTDAELAKLDSARGPAFDRLFVTFMIKHHEGALTMVDELFKSPGAAQDEFIYKLASDIFADQTAEIDRMQKLLERIPPE